MSNKELLEFWNSVEKTPTKYVKNSKVGGQNRTCVDAQFKKKLITEKFGMFGRGWGVDFESETFERKTFGDTQLLYYRAKAFYVIDSEKCFIPMAASIKEAYVTQAGKGYLKVDDEAIKKVRTDALTKAFTDLGFCSDIHMGMFDDQDYIRGLQAQEEIDRQDDYQLAYAKAYEKVEDWVREQMEAAKKIPNPDVFERAANQIIEQLYVRCKPANINPQTLINRINKTIEGVRNASK